MDIHNTKQPGKPQQILPAVAAAIFNDKGDVLLQKRKDVDRWAIISGHVEFGETIENAILREIEEETTLKANLVRFIGIYSSPDSQTYVYKDRTVQYVTSYFEARLTGSIPAGFSNEETGELKFFSPDSLPENLAPMDTHWLSDALTKNERIYIR